MNTFENLLLVGIGVVLLWLFIVKRLVTSTSQTAVRSTSVIPSAVSVPVSSECGCGCGSSSVNPVVQASVKTAAATPAASVVSKTTIVANPVRDAGLKMFTDAISAAAARGVWSEIDQIAAQRDAWIRSNGETPMSGYDLRYPQYG